MGKKMRSTWLILKILSSKGSIILRMNNSCICFISIHLASLPTEMLLLSRPILSLVESAISFWSLDKSLVVDTAMEYYTFKLKSCMQQWNAAESSDSGSRSSDSATPIVKSWKLLFLAVVKTMLFSVFAVCQYLTEVHTFWWLAVIKTANGKFLNGKNCLKSV